MCGEGGSNLELYRASLQDEGYAVQILDDPEVVQAALSEGGVDLVLLDLYEGGPAAEGRVRELAGGDQPVAVVLKESPSADDALALRGAGAREVLIRPFSMTKLARTVARVLNLDPLAGSPRAAAPPDAAGERRRLENQAGLEKARVEGLQARVESLKALMRRKDQEIGELREEVKLARDGERAARATGQEAAEGHRRAREAAEAEAQRLLDDLEARSQRHARQLELMRRDEESGAAGFAEQVRVLEGELAELREKYKTALQDAERLRTELAAARGSTETLAADQEDLAAQLARRDGEIEALKGEIRDREAQRDAVRAEVEALEVKLENAVRRGANEVKALVRERRKLAEEHALKLREAAETLEAERAQRKQVQLEFEGLKADLPQERRKVSALVDYQRSLTENVLAGILTVDTSGIITLGNELAGRFLEAPLSQLLGAHVDQCEAFGPLRALFAEALAGGRAGPVEYEIREGVFIRAQATKVPFGPRELVLLSVIAPDRVEVPVRDGGRDDEPDDGPLAQLGAAVAGNITDVQDFAVEVRSCLERLYGVTTPDTPARDEVNGALRKVGEMIDFLRDIIEQAESYLS